jgi:hypothetical protein
MSKSNESPINGWAWKFGLEKAPGPSAQRRRAGVFTVTANSAHIDRIVLKKHAVRRRSPVQSASWRDSSVGLSVIDETCKFGHGVTMASQVALPRLPGNAKGISWSGSILRTKKRTVE